MKKVFVLVLFLVSCVSVMNAQFSQFHVGVALPQGDFGDGDVDDDDLFGDGVGFAGTGFNVGYKYYNPLSAKNLSLVFALDVFYNGLNSDVKDEIEDDDNDIDVSLPAYLNIPVTLGLNYAHPLSSTIDLYGEVALGFNFSKITDLKIESENLETTTVFDPAFKFCYGLEGGVFINKKYSIGLKYNQLGSNKFKYTDKLEVDGDEEKEKGKFSKALSITNLSLSVGILF